jgi:hypothetical protein
VAAAEQPAEKCASIGAGQANALEEMLRHASDLAM